MPVSLYMDHHVPRAITTGLRLRGIDVLTAQEDGTTTLPDPDLLDRATALGRALFTQDDDLLAEAAHRQREGVTFGGVIYAHQDRTAIGACINDLELVVEASSSQELRDRVLYLPL